ncbi:MAG: pseudouridine synthase [bacterium]
MIREDFIVSQEEAWDRLDKVIQKRLGAAFSRARAQKLIESGAVTVNGRPKEADYRVRERDEVEIQSSMSKIQSEEREAPKADDRIPCDILFQDEDIAVVHKPAGVATHPGAGHFNDTLVSALRARLDHLSSYGAPLRPGIVHRLDMDTSGLLVVAKSDSAYLKIVAMIKAREVHRHYLALCWGWIKDIGQWLGEGGRKRIGFIKDGAGTIAVPIGRHVVERKKMAAATRAGRDAVTHFRILDHFKALTETPTYTSLSRTSNPESRAPTFTLVEATLDTGRTHQIRVHFKEIGHPLVGDTLYSPRKWQNVTAERDPALGARIAALPGQALVAYRLEFPHPITGAPLKFKCDPQAPLSELLRYLRNHAAEATGEN